jgi:hypothetical protein
MGGLPHPAKEIIVQAPLRAEKERRPPALTSDQDSHHLLPFWLLEFAQSHEFLRSKLAVKGAFDFREV